MKRFSDREKKYVLDVLKNEFRTSKNSKYNNLFEERLSNLFETKYTIGQVNGTTTMHTALAAGNVKPGDEVIVTPLTMSVLHYVYYIMDQFLFLQTLTHKLLILILIQSEN